MNKSPLALFLAVMLLACPDAHALVTADGPGTHLVTPGAMTFGMNLDGVGQVSFGGGSTITVGSGTLIGDRYVLTAAHVLTPLDLVNSTPQVRFNLSSGEVLADVVGFAAHPGYTGDPGFDVGVDLAILELAAPVPASVPRYELYRNADEVGQTYVHAGYGQSGFGGDAVRTSDGLLRAGLNTYDATSQTLAPLIGLNPTTITSALVADFDNGTTERDALGAFGIPHLGLGNDEVQAAPGDSGGPTFLQDTNDGLFKVAGVAAIILDTPSDLDGGVINSTFGELTASVRVSSYQGFIDDVLNSTTDTTKVLVVEDGLAHLGSEATLNNRMLVFRNGPGDAVTSLTVSTGDTVGFSSRVPGGARGARFEGHSTLTMNDGLIKGSSGVTLANQSRLLMHGGTHRALSPAGEGAFGDLSAGLLVRDQAIAEIHDGVIEGPRYGLLVTGEGQATVHGGVFDSPTFVPAAVFGGQLNIHGGTFSTTGDSFAGATATGESQLNITNGLIRGKNGILALQQAVIDIAGGAIQGTAADGPGVVVGGTVEVYISDGGIYGYRGIEARDNSYVDIAGGVIEASPADGQGVFAHDAVEVFISDGSISGHRGAQALGSSHIEVTGGMITGELDGLVVRGSATASVFDGRLEGQDNDGAGIVVEENAHVFMEGGTAIGGIGLVASDDARATIAGGSITATDSVGAAAFGNAVLNVLGGAIEGLAADLGVVGPEAMIVLHGTDFLLDGVPVATGYLAATGGTLTGRYLDGSPFDLTFSRIANGQIRLVPEPTTLVIAMMSVLVLGARRTSYSSQ